MVSKYRVEMKVKGFHYVTCKLHLSLHKLFSWLLPWNFIWQLLEGRLMLDCTNHRRKSIGVHLIYMIIFILVIQLVEACQINSFESGYCVNATLVQANITFCKNYLSDYICAPIKRVLRILQTQGIMAQLHNIRERWSHKRIIHPKHRKAPDTRIIT